MIFINLKTYAPSTGQEVYSLVSAIDNIAKAHHIKIIIAPQASDIKELTQLSQVELWAQHVDPVELGAHTGATTAEAVKEDGALGTFLNHSEKKFDEFADLQKAHTHAVAIGLKTLIFAQDTKELNKVLELEPTFASYEPPELVGSKETSVAKSKPDVIAEAVEASKKARIPLIVGAGVKDEHDVRKSLELGAVGVAVSSAVTNSDNPSEALEELVKGFL